ncbi:hypothetical protein Pmar_PMAR014583 [Perkinsus marinus ATCC 50983]|uniref:Uncharacterized protein n=1 Tax=Perkinsus marinus (strain ATCC 50983 / TXsc) TaxID=423536 RepID=C5LIG2_PERM5|nr:hypothetical protein Pmar_PMAR014583 [Perkinsus marinus ATCC 50983]EER03365.1 hypothetical protein Pmar_PMAR014583 [Perkinsus marinus ATCC 50983]|eukprot:XP_002771549.1 hypothetical protein Pmar_PMAR014583 [Perkinsus marinus ATCC 50983]
MAPKKRRIAKRCPRCARIVATRSERPCTSCMARERRRLLAEADDDTRGEVVDYSESRSEKEGEMAATRPVISLQFTRDVNATVEAEETTPNAEPELERDRSPRIVEGIPRASEQTPTASDFDRVLASRERYRAEAGRLQAKVRDLSVRREQTVEQNKAMDATLQDRAKQISQMQRTIDNLRCAVLQRRLDAEKIRKRACWSRNRLMKRNGQLMEYSAKLLTTAQELQAQLKVSNASVEAIQEAADDLSLSARNSVVPSQVVDGLVSTLPPLPSWDDDENAEETNNTREHNDVTEPSTLGGKDAPQRRVKQEE